MSDVNNTVGLDASKAIQSLDSLGFSIDTVNQKIEALNKKTKGDPFKTMNANAADAVKRITSLEARIKGLENQLRRAGRAGGQAGKEITLGWETVSRILQTQVLLRGLNALQQGFGEAAKSAQEFQLTVARTSAIASGPGSSFDELSVSIRQLSVDLGRPIAEVASASFQALQNDIADTTEASLAFVRASSELALVTDSELETAVNSLTSVLKSYGDEAGTAAENADILFRAIDVGRVRLDELENRLGTITPQAAALGISFAEAASAVSSLTLSGLDTAKSATQLRNILSKLIRPTTTLQAAFERLGVTTGQQLVAQYGGLQGALNALREAFDDNETAVASAFGTIRGELGILNLLANEGSEFDRVLGEITNSSGAVDEALKKVEATTARDFEKSLAQAQDTLLGVGNTLLEVKTSALDFFNTVVPSSQALEGIFLGLGVAATIAFANIATGAIAAKAAAIGLTGPIGLLAVGLGTIAALQFSNIPTLEGSLRSLEQAALDANKAIEESFEQTNDAIADKQADNIRRQDSLLRDFVQQSASYYADIRRNFERENERIEISALRTSESFRSAREDLISDLFGFIDSIDGRIEDSFGRVRDAQQDLADIQFERAQRGLTDLQKAVNELSRAQISAGNAREQFINAGFDESERQAALQLQQTAEQQARDALRSAERLGDIQLINRAEQNLIGTVQQRIELEQRAQAALAGIDQTRAREQADQAEAIRRRQAAITQELDALNSRRDEQGQLRDRNPQALAEEEARIASLVQEFRTLETELQGLEIIDQADVRNQVDRAAKSFEEGLASVRFDIRGAIDELQTELRAKDFEGTIQLEAVLSQTSVAAFQDNLEQALTGGDVGQRFQQRRNAANEFILSQRQAIAESERAGKLLEAQFDQIARTGTEAFQAPRQLGSLVNSLGSSFFGERIGEGLKDIIPEQQQEVDGFITQIGLLALKLKQEGAPAIKEVESSLKDVSAELAGSPLQTELPAAITLITRQIEETARAVELLQQKSEAAGKVEVGIEDIQQLELEALQVSAAAGKVALEFRGIGSNARGASDSSQTFASNTQSAIGPAQQLLDIQSKIANEAERAANAQAQAAVSGPQPKFFGGSVFRNFGGDITRGQDQRLVAASAGEFFVNERSSSRFFSQLQAINAGQNPVFRDQGGPVTNVGDINVNIDARNARSVDGREIARTLDREMRRRGSNSLRG